MDLEDYERTTGRSGGPGRKCITCALDPALLAQIHQGRARKPKPVSFETIAKWLEGEIDRRIHPTTIRNHFMAGHHND